MSVLDRVVFFSKDDLAGAPMLEKARQILEMPQDFGRLDLNSLLEFHHIQQYFDCGLYPENSSAGQKEKYTATVKQAMASIRVRLVSLIPDKLPEGVALLEFNNVQNFWELVRYFELYKTIGSELFMGLLTAHPHHIRYILPLKQIVQHYDQNLRAFMMTEEESAELLLAHYEQKNERPTNYFFPKSLSEADKHAMIAAYLVADEPNLNYVELVRHSRNLKLPPKILLKAKQVAEKIKEKILSDENARKLSVGASLDRDQAEPVTYKTKDHRTFATYGGLFLDSIETDVKLFAVFSQLFLYTDTEGLITLINRATEMDVLERIGVQANNEYLTGLVFAKKDMLSVAQLGILDHYLQDKGRSIETLLANTVKDLFVDYFKMDGLSFTMPEAKLGATDKIRLLAPEMEYIVKQYKDFVANGKIDHELLELDSNPIYYSDVPSLLRKKYIYSGHQKIRTIQYHFFDESSIFAMSKIPAKRETFFKKLEPGTLKKSDFEPYQIPSLEQAVAEGDLSIDADGFVGMTDPMKVIIAGKLRDKGVISYWHYGAEFRAEIDRLINEGLLTSSDQLFTTEEVSYLNFYLNKKEFTNGKDLRNKYLHGSNAQDPQQQKIDSLYFLRTFVLILLKLKDDLLLHKHHLSKTGS